MEDDRSPEMWVGMVGDRLKEQIPEIVDVELARMRDEAPEFFTSNDPDYVAAYTASCVAHLSVLIKGMTSGRDIPSSMPSAAVDETRSVAQWGIPLEALTQTYRTAHAVIWETAMGVAEDLIDNPRTRSSVLRLVSRYLFAYTDRMVQLLTVTFDEERRSLMHDRERHRRQMVRDVLDGLPVDQLKLPYLLSGTHVAAIASGARATLVIPEMAAACRLQYLSVPGPSTTVWAWFEGSSLAQPEKRDALFASIPPEASVSLGDVGTGVSGFRTSHREARQAYRIAHRTRVSSNRFADIALVALASIDETLAQDFVTRELGFLAEDDPRSNELRETISAYFAAGHNASAAAGKLMLNDRTVAYRLKTIEERLGRSVLSRRDEMAVALRLREVLGTAEDGDRTGGLSDSDFR